MIKSLKQFAAYLDVWKKLAQTILIIAPVLAMLGTCGTWVFNKVYHKEIESAKAVVRFMQVAQDSIIPEIKRDVEILQSKHNGNYAIGLRWDEAHEKVMYRGTDKKLREAHQYPIDKKWYFINKQGYAELIFP